MNVEKNTIIILTGEHHQHETMEERNWIEIKNDYKVLASTLMDLSMEYNDQKMSVILPGGTRLSFEEIQNIMVTQAYKKMFTKKEIELNLSIGAAIVTSEGKRFLVAGEKNTDTIYYRLLRINEDKLEPLEMTFVQLTDIYSYFEDTYIVDIIPADILTTIFDWNEKQPLIKYVIGVKNENQINDYRQSIDGSAHTYTNDLQSATIFDQKFAFYPVDHEEQFIEVFFNGVTWEVLESMLVTKGKL